MQEETKFLETQSYDDDCHLNCITVCHLQTASFKSREVIKGIYAGRSDELRNGCMFEEKKGDGYIREWIN